MSLRCAVNANPERERWEKTKQTESQTFCVCVCDAVKLYIRKNVNVSWLGHNLDNQVHFIYLIFFFVEKGRFIFDPKREARTPYVHTHTNKYPAMPQMSQVRNDFWLRFYFVVETQIFGYDGSSFEPTVAIHIVQKDQNILGENIHIHVYTQNMDNNKYTRHSVCVFVLIQDKCLHTCILISVKFNKNEVNFRVSQPGKLSDSKQFWRNVNKNLQHKKKKN